MLVTGESALLALGAGLLIATITTPVGVSGAVFLLPVQLSVLHVPSPAVTPTNLLFNVVVRILGALPSDSPTTFDELADKVAMSSEGLARRLRMMTDEGLIEKSGTDFSITDYGVDALAAQVAYIAEMTRKVPRPELGHRF